MSTPLLLNQLVFTDVRITAQLGIGSISTFETVVEFNGRQHSDNNRDWMVTVRVHIKPTDDNKIPYIGSVECIGTFTVVPEWPEDQVEKLVLVNGTGMMFSAIREMICNITARGPYQMLLLPSQSFLETYQRGKTGASIRSVTPANVVVAD